MAKVQSRQLQHQSDLSLLLQHLKPERHDAIRIFLGDAPTFNVVFFDKVYDCRELVNLNLSELVARVPGLQEPASLNGPGFLTRCKAARDALLSLLQGCDCSVRNAYAQKQQWRHAQDSATKRAKKATPLLRCAECDSRYSAP